MSPHLYDNNVNRLFETELSKVVLQPPHFDINQTSKSGSSIFVVLYNSSRTTTFDFFCFFCKQTIHVFNGFANRNDFYFTLF